MKRQTFLLFLVIAILLPLCANADIVYEVIDLGTLGGRASCAFTINNSGQIVGFASLPPAYFPSQATLFDPTGSGKNISLGTVGGQTSIAYYINEGGDIVGWADDKADRQHATLFDPTGNRNNVILAGDYAYSINENGQIIGQAGRYAAMFNPSGGVVYLGTLGGSWSNAFSNNDSGQIVGAAENSFGDIHATLFDPSGKGNNLDLGTLGGDGGWAKFINESGQIIGFSYNTSGDKRAALFDSSGKGNNIDLGVIPGYVDSIAWSINNKGQVVGWVEDGSGSALFDRAVLFDLTGRGNNIDLNTLIAPDSGWTLRRAYSINDYGWIVGGGINPDGESHAYLLIPEPATLLLLGFGGLIVRRKE